METYERNRGEKLSFNFLKSLKKGIEFSPPLALQPNVIELRFFKL